MLPNSWDDLFYLMRKEVQQHPDLPNFSIPQLKKIHNILWINVKELMRDESSEISLPTFLRIVPKKDANYTNKPLIKKYEKSRKVFNNGPDTNESSTRKNSKKS